MKDSMDDVVGPPGAETSHGPVRINAFAPDVMALEQNLLWAV
jgi:hypothetical protein